MNELTIASKRLFDNDALKVSNFKMFPGSNRDTTAEQFAAQINKMVSQIEAGDFEMIDFANEG